jgi:hypothetical protein
MSVQRLKLVWGGKVGTKDTQETWEWNRKVGTAEITRDTVPRSHIPVPYTSSAPPVLSGGFRGGVRGVRPPKIRKAYVMQR